MILLRRHRWLNKLNFKSKRILKTKFGQHMNPFLNGEISANRSNCLHNSDARMATWQRRSVATYKTEFISRRSQLTRRRHSSIQFTQRQTGLNGNRHLKRERDSQAGRDSVGWNLELNESALNWQVCTRVIPNCSYTTHIFNCLLDTIFTTWKRWGG